MEFSVNIDQDGTTHTKISCEGKTFSEVRAGLKAAIVELQRTLDEQERCPMHVPEVLRPLYVKTSKGTWVELNNAEVSVSVTQSPWPYLGRDFESAPRDTQLTFTLRFENELPDEWMEDHTLEFMGEKFRVESYECTNGKYKAEAVAIKRV